MCFSFFLLRDYFLALSFCMQEFSWTTCDTSWTPALFWPLAVVREMSLKVHLLPHTDSRGRQEGESKELLLCLHILIESFWRLKMNPASLVSRVDVYAELNVACYLCASGPELLFNFSVICTQWKESVFRFKHMCIHKHSCDLKKVLFVPCSSTKSHGQTVQDASLQASAEAFSVPQLDGNVFCIIL